MLVADPTWTPSTARALHQADHLLLLAGLHDEPGPSELEGRLGAAASGGTARVPCATTDGVDANIIASVERVLTSQGSPLAVDRVQEIRIFKATSTGAETAGKVNVWTYSASAGPTVDGTKLHFVQGTVNWSACGRDNGSSPDSVGIGVKYRYDMRTPLSGILRFFGGPGATQLQISDKTVMALNP